jgi:hypothetical protein
LLRMMSKTAKIQEGFGTGRTIAPKIRCSCRGGYATPPHYAIANFINNRTS